jgi:plastocyanin
MRFSPWHAALIASAAIGGGCDDVGGPGTVFPDADATVYMRDNYFDAASVTISAGGKVLWIYAGGNPHNGIFRNGVGPENCPLAGVGFCLREFPSAGSFVYDCTLHGGMTGVVNVNP